MFIDNAEADDALGKINAYVSNRALSHITGLVIPLGLILMLYGISGINRVIVGQAIREDSTAAAFSRLGILCLTVGAFGWVIISGLALVLAQTNLDSDQAVQAAIAVYRVDSGITILSSAAVATGFLAFNLGLAALFPSGSARIWALVIAAVSLIALIALIIGHTTTTETGLAISRLCYIPWVIWRRRPRHQIPERQRHIDGRRQRCLACLNDLVSTDRKDRFPTKSAKFVSGSVAGCRNLGPSFKNNAKIAGCKRLIPQR